MTTFAFTRHELFFKINRYLQIKLRLKLNTTTSLKLILNLMMLRYGIASLLVFDRLTKRT